MLFQLADHGQVFSTRTKARELREEVERQLAPDEELAISFDSVARVSQSFSDEFLGCLLSHLGRDRVEVIGPLSPSVERVLTRALRHRGFSGAEILAAAC
jgi:STAS-like domain of unknown function (DUF4325)